MAQRDGRALVRNRRRLDADGSVAGPSRSAMPARRRPCCWRGVRVQSAASAAGRADRRPLLSGGCAAVRPADAAADAVGAAHRQPRGAVRIRGGTDIETAEYADGCVVTMPTRALEFGYPLWTRSVGVHFKPWGLAPFLPMPAAELCDRPATVE